MRIREDIVKPRMLMFGTIAYIASGILLFVIGATPLGENEAIIGLVIFIVICIIANQLLGNMKRIELVEAAAVTSIYYLFFAVLEKGVMANGYVIEEFFFFMIPVNIFQLIGSTLASFLSSDNLPFSQEIFVKIISAFIPFLFVIFSKENLLKVAYKKMRDKFDE